MSGSAIEVGVLDDSQTVARASADWSRLEQRAAVTILRDGFRDIEDAARKLAGFDILIPMRERTPFPAALIERLPRLKMIALTGVRAPTLDLQACAARGIVVSNTPGDHVTAATAELTWALVLACARDIAAADAGMKAGRFHEGVRIGMALEGKRLGIVGLGKLGRRVAQYGKAFGMDVVAWSQNLTVADAAAGGALRVDKAELFATSDVVSLHLVLSERTRHVVGPEEISALKPGAILVNTARGPLIHGDSLLQRLRRGDIVAGLDVYDVEPPAADDALRSLPNVVLSPHLGYSTHAVFAQFYQTAVDNVLAFLDGAPTRVITPAVG